MKKITTVLIVLFVLAAACKKDDSGTVPEGQMLPVQIFDEGVLSIQLFYDDDYSIDSIQYFWDTGLPWHTDVFEWNDSGRVKNVYGKYFGPNDATYVHEEKHEMIYKEGKKIKSVRYRRYIHANDSVWRKAQEFRYEYPSPELVIRNEYTSEGELRNTHTFKMDNAGNVVDQQYVTSRSGGTNYHWLYTYDHQPSPWHLIDEKLPGYYTAPESKNNRTSRKSLTEEGDVRVTITYKNEYNGLGYVTKQSALKADGNANRSPYRFDYIAVEY